MQNGEEEETLNGLSNINPLFSFGHQNVSEEKTNKNRKINKLKWMNEWSKSQK